jgi:hypothetical protein
MRSAILALLATASIAAIARSGPLHYRLCVSLRIVISAMQIVSCFLRCVWFILLNGRTLGLGLSLPRHRPHLSQDDLEYWL